MRLAITSVDYNPLELDEQVPFAMSLLRMVPGPDRPDYWLGKLDKPLRWIDNNHERQVEYLAICARWQGTHIGPDMPDIPVGIAYVTDQSQISEANLSFNKCKYVAIGMASKMDSDEMPAPLDSIISGNIARGFGTGGKARSKLPSDGS